MLIYFWNLFFYKSYLFVILLALFALHLQFVDLSVFLFAIFPLFTCHSIEDVKANISLPKNKYSPLVFKRKTWPRTHFCLIELRLGFQFLFFQSMKMWTQSLKEMRSAMKIRSPIQKWSIEAMEQGFEALHGLILGEILGKPEGPSRNQGIQVLVWIGARF